MSKSRRDGLIYLILSGIVAILVMVFVLDKFPIIGIIIYFIAMLIFQASFIWLTIYKDSPPEDIQTLDKNG